jgi:hypothetical protein
VPVQPGEGLLDHVLGGERIVDQQAGQPDHAHPVVAVEIGQRAGFLRIRLHGRSCVEAAQPRQRHLDGVRCTVARHVSRA